eukprot:1175398-Prorocentrum_minimum.AAC.2
MNGYDISSKSSVHGRWLSVCAPMCPRAGHRGGVHRRAGHLASHPRARAAHVAGAPPLVRRWL